MDEKIDTDTPQADPSEKQADPSLTLVPNDHLLPANLFILPINSPIVFPTLLAPIFVSQPKLIGLIEEAMNRQRIFGLLLFQEGEIKDNIKPEHLFQLGVAVKVLKRIKMPDGSINLLVHSLKRFKVQQFLSEEPFLVAQVNYLLDETEKNDEMDALIRLAIGYVKKLSEVNPFFTDEMKLALLNAPSSATIADLIAFALTLPKKEAQDYLETLSVKERFLKLLVHLKREQELADLQRKINEEVNTKLNKMQREFFLKEQMKSIKKELDSQNENEKTSKNFKERILEAKMPAFAEKTALEEYEKLENTSEQSPEHNVIRNYLELICALPWSKSTEDNLDLVRAQKILDTAHFGLEKIKERIIEFLAVRKLRKSNKGSVICLVGPPGVGKTSIGKSIAETMGRAFFRFSLGGMRDEAEIKGHRRTYIGSMPGKIIQVMKRTEAKNPVLMLDEIDKMLQSYHGDPASALLEVLDVEQNTAFLDHYLDIPFDLSEVLFITTANTTASIPAPLLDRMEIIEIPGYTMEEKLDIIKNYILPKEIQEVGLPENAFRIPSAVMARIIREYAREPGLRSAQKALQRICRKVASKIVMDKAHLPLIIRDSTLLEYLGPARFFNEINDRIVVAGVVIGLAWTILGGEILFIEAIQTPGSGQLKLTGHMGEVMTESANLAFSFVKRYLQEKGLWDEKHFKKTDIHVHIPAGSIPKDGPSAGVTLATALISLLSKKKVLPKIAMTGELSLIGKVLPVGGIKEKLLAAHRAGIKTVFLPTFNKKDLAEVPSFVLDRLEIHFVKRLEEILALALSH